MSHQDAAGMLKMNCSVVQLKTSLSMARGVGLVTFKFPFQTKLFYGPEHAVCLPGHPGTPKHAMVHQRGWGAMEGTATGSRAGGLGKGVSSLQKRQGNTHQRKQSS